MFVHIHTRGKLESDAKSYSEKLKGRELQEVIGIDGRMILKVVRNK
jgi:hypothetical protein